MDKKKVPSRFKIVVWFIFFWPVGLYYLLKRAEIDIKGGRTYSRIIEGIGWFFVIIGFIALMGIFFAEKEVVIFLILCGLIYIGGGYLLVKKSKKVYGDWRNFIQPDEGGEIMLTRVPSKGSEPDVERKDLLIDEKDAK